MHGQLSGSYAKRPSRFAFVPKIYCFVALFASWYCSKEAKRTHPCIIVIVLFQTWFRVTKKEHEPRKHSTLSFLRFLFFSCFAHCKSGNTHLNAYHRQRWGSPVGTFLSCSTGKPSLFFFFFIQPIKNCMCIQFYYPSLTVCTVIHLNPTLVKFESLHMHNAYAIFYSLYPSPQPQPQQKRSKRISHHMPYDALHVQANVTISLLNKKRKKKHPCTPPISTIPFAMAMSKIQPSIKVSFPILNLIL